MTMEANPLHRRGQASEESYFRQIEAEKLQRLRSDQARAALREDLESKLGTGDAALVDRLIDLGIDRDTVEALEALPLVDVAWADGGVDDKERARVLVLAEQLGLGPDTPAHALVEGWLTRRPEPVLAETWYRLAARPEGLRSGPERAHLVLEGAHEVAMASGGLLGFGGVSKAERAVLERIARALGRERVA
jgi:tellurite resistance protein